MAAAMTVGTLRKAVRGLLYASQIDAPFKVVSFPADEEITVEVLVAPHRPVGFDDALGETQHHGERVLGDRLLVAARLIEHQNARIRAGREVDGIVARAVGGDDQQALRAAQEIAVGVIFFGELVARGPNLEGMRAGKHGRGDVVGTVVLQPIEPTCTVNTGGVQYNFTRRTFFLGQYSRVKNNATSACNFGTGDERLPITAGQNPQGFSLGLRHIF